MRMLIIVGVLMILLASPNATRGDSQSNLTREAYKLILSHLYAWKSEAGEVNCKSQNLVTAVAGAVAVRDVLVGEGGRTSIEYGMLAGNVLLEVADVAKKECPEVADMLYRLVIGQFTGLGYAALRARAAIGLADIRGSQ